MACPSSIRPWAPPAVPVGASSHGPEPTHECLPVGRCTTRVLAGRFSPTAGWKRWKCRLLGLTSKAQDGYRYSSFRSRFQLISQHEMRENSRRPKKSKGPHTFPKGQYHPRFPDRGFSCLPSGSHRISITTVCKLCHLPVKTLWPGRNKANRPWHWTRSSQRRSPTWRSL